MAIQENYVRTASDLERKYNLSQLTGIKQAVELNTIGINKVENSVSEFSTYVIGDLENLHNQIDGNITTWFYSGEPTNDNAPANEWTTTELKQQHIGDLYYDRDTGYAYRYTLDGTEYKWIKLTDSDISQALAVANSAKDTADSKRRVFVNTPTTPYDVGDIWFKDDKDLYRCQTARTSSDNYDASDWILATNYTDDTIANNALAQVGTLKTEVETNYVTNTKLTTETEKIEGKVTTLETAINGKAQVFTSEPTPPYYVGDIYIKEITGDNITQELIYVCQTERLTGVYEEDDFSLQPTYASQSDLQIESDNIKSQVTQVITGEVENLVSKDELSQYQAEVSTKFTQTSTSFEMDFTNVKTLLNDLEEKVDDNANNISKYIRFDNGTIILGATDSAMSVKLTNDRLSFYQGSDEVAYISDKTLYITDSIFLQSVKIGSFKFEPRTNGSLSFGKVE